MSLLKFLPAAFNVVGRVFETHRHNNKKVYCVFAVGTFTGLIVSLLMSMSSFASVDAMLITDLCYFCKYILLICDINYKTTTSQLQY